MSKGRVDTVVHSKSHIYIIEFKLDASATSAMEQICAKPIWPSLPSWCKGRDCSSREF